MRSWGEWRARRSPLRQASAARGTSILVGGAKIALLTAANGDSLAESTAGIPSFVGIMPRTLKHFLK